MNKLVAMSALALVSGGAIAGTTDIRLTEIYMGVGGNNGTSDWFELTNYGTTAVSTEGFFYDDDSFDATKNDALSTLFIGAGESVVFLVSWEDDYTDAVDAIADFIAYWGAGTQVGFVDGGSGLGGGGDAAAVFAGNTEDAALVASGTYTSSLAEQGATVEFPSGPVGQLSQLGVNGAYGSLLGAGDTGAPIIGSPGAVPAPGAAALLAMGGLVAGRRRRA